MRARAVDQVCGDLGQASATADLELTLGLRRGLEQPLHVLPRAETPGRRLGGRAQAVDGQPAGGPLGSPAVVRRAVDGLATFGTILTEKPVSLYAAAVLRIGYGLFYLTFLLTEFSHRNEI